jgi:hypothetical protein
MGHDKSSCRWGNCEGLRAAGLDTRANAVVGVPGSTLLSRELVTVLPPPVGGLSRTLSANQIGGREPSGCFGGSARDIGGLANSALIAVSGFVRYGTMRRQGLGHLQLTRKRRHRQTSRLRDRSQSGSPLRFGGLGRDARASRRDCPLPTKCRQCSADSTQSSRPQVVGVDQGHSE